MVVDGESSFSFLNESSGSFFTERVILGDGADLFETLISHPFGKRKRVRIRITGCSEEISTALFVGQAGSVHAIAKKERIILFDQHRHGRSYAGTGPTGKILHVVLKDKVGRLAGCNIRLEFAINRDQFYLLAKQSSLLVDLFDRVLHSCKISLTNILEIP